MRQRALKAGEKIRVKRLLGGWRGTATVLQDTEGARADTLVQFRRDGYPATDRCLACLREVERFRHA